MLPPRPARPCDPHDCTWLQAYYNKRAKEADVLQALSHPHVIAVRTPYAPSASHHGRSNPSGAVRTIVHESTRHSQLKDTFDHKGSLCMVFEFMPSDLDRVLPISFHLLLLHWLWTCPAVCPCTLQTAQIPRLPEALACQPVTPSRHPGPCRASASLEASMHAARLLPNSC